MDAVFGAVAADPRRAILERLAEGERTVNELLAHFSFSQPALSKHLRILREARLVRVREDGRHRYYTLEPTGLRDIAEWIHHFEAFWDDRLDRLSEVLDREADR